MNTTEHLIPECQYWAEQLTREHGLSTDIEKLLLMSGMEALQRLRQIQERIERDGLMLEWGDGVRAHPLLSHEKEARAQFLRAMSELNLSVDAKKIVGGRGRQTRARA